MTGLSMTAARPWRSGARTIGMLPAITLLLCASLLMALEMPSKPFLDKNSFYLSSAGFRIQLANDAAAKKAMHALPPHRFVVHRYGNDVRYLYAEPNHCTCIFIGTASAYDSYRGMLAQAGRPARFCRARLQDAGRRVAQRHALRVQLAEPGRRCHGPSARLVLARRAD